MTEFLARRERFARVGSTNDVVRDWLAAGTPEVCLAVADEQTAGRGREGRTWVAPPGAALLLSLGFRPDLAGAGPRLAPGRHRRRSRWPTPPRRSPACRTARSASSGRTTSSSRRSAPWSRPLRSADRRSQAGRRPGRDRGPRRRRPAGRRRHRHRRRLGGRRLPARPRDHDDLAARGVRRPAHRPRRAARRLPRPPRGPRRGAARAAGSTSPTGRVAS